ncbi:MAG: hypothetical protein HDS65_06855 [Bacteroidales bacterium]|nr:hypothetical protein [Bacteroidales bacterium]
MDMEDSQQLIARLCALPDGAALSAEDTAALRALDEEHPFAVVPAVLLLRHCPALPADVTASLRTKVALLSSDPRTTLFAAHGDDWARFYPEPAAPEAMQTTSVIDTFLSTYGSCSPEEEALLERMIFNPAPDYAELLAREEQENLPPEGADEPGSADERINAFIRSRHPAANPPELLPDPEPAPEPAPDTKPVERPEPSDDSLLSESLAKIFIKRGRYEKAYEIISGLNLKFPKKSVYFADQLRFLQKLIINRRQLDSQENGGAPEK